MPKKVRRSAKASKKEPNDFDVRFSINEAAPSYNALKDKNLSNYFCQKTVQRRLMQTGLITRDGRLVDQNKRGGKILIVEQELKAASDRKAREIAEREELERQRVVLEKRKMEMRKKARMVAELKQETATRRMNWAKKFGSPGALGSGKIVSSKPYLPSDLPPAPALDENDFYCNSGRDSEMSFSSSKFSEDHEMEEVNRELMELESGGAPSGPIDEAMDVQLAQLGSEIGALMNAYGEEPMPVADSYT
ncbi:hypothetical protein J8273_1239 [Carpediemonas membranifera]|uniref:Uncharacterized protein n=1 Tax=Carpediemonas membranifera TaxID=201153 RepID=A0A8J6BA54_9EUKA|nr:hypothetical protein J8273_1239 [Carpediemonas membranifera]|eukprot:KAG9397324.1 hypothetical protein J8273_1239 [Carpediemonas membranifera]